MKIGTLLNAIFIIKPNRYSPELELCGFLSQYDHELELQPFLKHISLFRHNKYSSVIEEHEQQHQSKRNKAG